MKIVKKLSKTSSHSRRSSTELINALSRPKRKRKVLLRPGGQVYHLANIQKEISEIYFNGEVELPITWFGSGKIPKTSILFGSYSHQTGLIKVNRVLDSETFPKCFVAYIVYHEMLHHIYPPKRGKRGRWDIHHEEYKAKEKQFLQYQEAKAFLKTWKKMHLDSRQQQL